MTIPFKQSPDVDFYRSILGWTDGPLQHPGLEQAACELFSDSHPMGLWSEPDYKAERDLARKQIIRVYVRFLKDQQWTLSNCVEKLTEQGLNLTFGDRAIGSSIRKEMENYVESFFEDMASIFPRKLFYPREAEKNAAEVAKETN